MTEEMKDAKKDAPKAIIWAVWVGTVTGFLFLIALMFCIVDVDTAASTPTGEPFIAILQQATGSTAGAAVLATLVTIIALVSLCFLSAQSSRVVFAFARDRGLPFSYVISRVNPRSHVPVNSIILVTTVNIALISIYFGSITGFNTVLAVSTEAFCKF